MTDITDTKPDGTEAYFGPVTRKGAQGREVPPTKISGPEDYAQVKPGAMFIDPEGVTRRKSYTVANEGDYARVPEGESYIDPEGQQRTKPKYEQLDFTAQTLYDMAVNDKERQKALERSYPGKVKRRDTGEFYVEDNGTLRRPHGMTEGGFLPGLAGQAAPVVGSTAGEIGGGALGSVGGPVGTAAGAIAGGGIGGAAGQALNDAFLQLAGVYDRSGGEEAEELALSGAFGAGGTAIGRGLAAVGPAVKGKITNTLPSAAAHFLGADEQGLATAIQLREQGVLVPPSAWAKESPHLQNVVEVFDPAFRTQKPLLQSATQHYEKSAGEVLSGLGAPPAAGESISKPVAAVSTEEAGVKLLSKAREESSKADIELRAALDARKATATAQGAAAQAEHAATRDALAKSEKDARVAAEKIINAGFQAIQDDIDTAMKATKAGANSGELWWSVGEKLKQVKQGITARARKMYGEADELAGGHLPNTEGLAEIAKDFLTQLPEGFEGKYPSIVKQLRDLAGEVAEDGTVVREPVQPTFGQLHNLRSIMRSNINYLDLTPDIREGVYKFFAKHVDDILHDPQTVAESNVTKVKSPTDINPNQKVKVGLVHRGVEGGTDAIGGLRKFKGGDIGDGVYMTPDKKLASSYGGGPKASVAAGTRNVHSYTVKDLYPEEVAYVFGGKKIGSDVQIVSGNGVEIYNGPWSPKAMEGALGDTKVVIGTPDSIGVGQISIRDASVLQVRSQGQEALAEAARALDNADRFYRENMGPLNDKNIQAVMNGLESGMPADPKILYNTLIKEGRSDLTRKVRDLVGPTLWAGIKAADMQEMLDASRSLIPGQIDGNKFAQQVLDRYRSGMLEAVHDPKGVEKLITQAQHVAMLGGKLDVAVRPGDSVAEVIAKARSAAEAAKQAAKADPLATLNKEMKTIQREHSQTVAKAQAERRKDPLGFLYNPTTGASEAVEKILGSEDLIIASAAKFGENSPEFNMLRQVYAKQILQGTLEPSKRLAGISEEVQRIMFPGVSLDQMKTLAKEMDFLMSSRGARDTAKSMAAVSKVEHPWSSIPGGKLAGKILPGADAGGRAMLGGYYKMITELSNNLAFLRWIEKGLKGDQAARERSKEAVQRAMRMGGAIGAAGGESIFQGQTP